MNVLRPVPSIITIIGMFLMCLCFPWLFAAIVFFTVDDADAARIVFSMLFIVAGIVAFAVGVNNCMPVILMPDGTIRSGMRRFHITDCERVVIKHEGRSWWSTIILMRKGKIRLSSHSFSREDAHRAVDFGKVLRVPAYELLSNGKFRKLQDKRQAR